MLAWLGTPNGTWPGKSPCVASNPFLGVPCQYDPSQTQDADIVSGLPRTCSVMSQWHRQSTVTLLL